MGKWWMDWLLVLASGDLAAYLENQGNCGWKGLWARGYAATRFSVTGQQGLPYGPMVAFIEI